MIGATLRRLGIASLAVLVVQGGCSGGGFAPPPIEAGALATEEQERAVQLISDRIKLSGRLRDIEYGIVTAAAAFCRGVTRPNLGVVLASESTFTGDIARNAAREKVGLDKRVSLAHVVSSSPLALAGIQSGDVLVWAGGRDIATQDDFFKAIDGNRSKITIRVEREKQTIEREVEPEQSCPVSLEYVSSAQLLPDRTSRTTAGVPRGLIRFLKDDSELAILIGHQLAHLIFDRASDSDIDKERRADTIGLYLTARAGYDVTKAVEVWERLIGEYPWLAVPRQPGQYSGYPHLGVALRTAGMKKTIAEIQQKLETRAPLIPPS